MAGTNGIMIVGAYDRGRRKQTERQLMRKTQQGDRFDRPVHLPHDNDVDPISSSTYGKIGQYECLIVRGGGAEQTTVRKDYGSHCERVANILVAPGVREERVRRSERNDVYFLLGMVS